MPLRVKAQAEPADQAVPLRIFSSFLTFFAAFFSFMVLAGSFLTAFLAS
jgi:hypothetical protein